MLKVELRYADAKQATALFERTFAPELGAALGPTEKAHIIAAFQPVKNVAPGAFAVVARRIRVFGVQRTREELLELVLGGGACEAGCSHTRHRV